MTDVDFSGCGSLADVVEALWANASVAVFFAMTGRTAPAAFPQAEMNEILTLSRDYIDYLGGRCMKISVGSFPVLNSRGFDRDAGEGTMRRVRDTLLNRKSRTDSLSK